MREISPEEQEKKEAVNQLYKDVSRLINGQLNGSFDSFRSKEIWLKSLPKWLEISPEDTAIALTTELDRKLCININDLIKGLRLG